MNLTAGVGDQLSFTQHLESTSTLSTAKPRPETDLLEGRESSSSGGGVQSQLSWIFF